MTVFEGKTSKQYLFTLHFILKKKLPQKVKTENCAFYAFLKGWGGWLQI